MIDLQPPFRHARADDAAALAELVNFAGDGLPLYLWEKMAAPGESAWEVGRRRARRDEGSFSYRNAVVVETETAVQATVMGCLIGYPEPEAPTPIDARMPAMFVPMQELENLAPASWYVNVLALYPQFRGQGWGARILGIADAIAARGGRPTLSVIVSDANTGARRLYQRCGYRETARRPMVKDDWQNPGREWVLLVKQCRTQP
jgi:ribosomal protein S18 acetylase RimI-like enzyme